MLHVGVIVGAMSKWERILLAAFGVVFAITMGLLLRRFYNENTILIPATGGTYIEGSVGDLRHINPWFTVTNDVNRDIVSLVFAGIERYNPETKKIEDDLGELSVGGNGKIYTARLKEGLFWHDSTEEQPHPVTADDVLFTFSVLKDTGFPNELLKQNFRGVQMEKIDDRTVRFTLDEPYSFFPSNLALGLLPKSAFEGIPPSRLAETIDFSLHPIGAGPYSVRSIVQTELSTEVTLERFSRPVSPVYRLDRIVFRVFPDYQSLLTDLRNLDGVRVVPRSRDGDPLVPRGFSAVTYTLPQYVALFLNMQRKIFDDPKLRLGLQLGTNKQEIADEVHEPHLVDTPLLEIDTGDWRYHFDPEAAQGAFFASNWNLPEKIRLQRMLERRDANAIGILHPPPVLFLDTGAVLTLTGSLRAVSTGSLIHGLPVQRHPTETGSFLVELPTSGGTGSLLPGENLIRVIKPGKRLEILDSFFLYRATNREEYRRALEEQRLVDLFLASKDGKVPAEKRVTVENFTLEKGFLRTRHATDPVSVRRNETGKTLSLTLLSSPKPDKYGRVANIIEKQWRSLGVDLQIVIPETQEAFEERLLARDYDILLFGQSLLDNLDSYPYWHSSGVQRNTGRREDLRRDAYNLSNYSSFKADTLLETVRRTRDENERKRALEELRGILSEDVPAIFLYSPVYTFAHRETIRGVIPGALSLHSDRFLTFYRWYVKENRVFRAGKSWLSFFGWLPIFFFPTGQ